MRRVGRLMATYTCGNCGVVFEREAYRGNLFCGRACYSAARSNATPVRFWAHTKPADNGCIEWMGAPQKFGYGVVRVDGEQRKAHRHAWILTHGAIPDGLFICHRCDNKICVNPEHLFLGTAHDNMRDMSKKGRSAGSRRKGEAHPMVRLSADQVRDIRSRYQNRARYGNASQLASEYGVSRRWIWQVATGRVRTEVSAQE
jgi:hypothetical protein